ALRPARPRARFQRRSRERAPIASVAPARRPAALTVAALARARTPAQNARLVSRPRRLSSAHRRDGTPLRSLFFTAVRRALFLLILHANAIRDLAARVVADVEDALAERDLQFAFGALELNLQVLGSNRRVA